MDVCESGWGTCQDMSFSLIMFVMFWSLNKVFMAVTHHLYCIYRPASVWLTNKYQRSKKEKKKNMYARLYTSSILLLAHITGNESGWFGRWGGKAGRPGGRRRCRWGRTWRRGHNWKIAGSLDTRQSVGGLCRHPPRPTPAATGRTSPLHTAGTDLQRWQWGGWSSLTYLIVNTSRPNTSVRINM